MPLVPPITTADRPERSNPLYAMCSSPRYALLSTRSESYRIRDATHVRLSHNHRPADASSTIARATVITNIQRQRLDRASVSSVCLLNQKSTGRRYVVAYFLFRLPFSGKIDSDENEWAFFSSRRRPCIFVRYAAGRQVVCAGLSTAWLHVR